MAADAVQMRKVFEMWSMAMERLQAREEMCLSAQHYFWHGVWKEEQTCKFQQVKKPMEAIIHWH